MTELSIDPKISPKEIRHDLANVLALLQFANRYKSISSTDRVGENLKESISRIQLLIGRLDELSKYKLAPSNDEGN